MQRDSSYLTIEVRQDGKDCVLLLRGELDMLAVSRVRQAMTAAAGSDTGPLVLDLTGLTYIDCCGARLIAQTGRSAGDPRRVTAGSLTPRARKIFDVTGIEPPGGRASPAPPKPQGKPAATPGRN